MTEEKWVRTLTAGKMKVTIYQTRKEMGYAAAMDVAKMLCKMLKEKEEVNIVFPCAMSQVEFFDELFKMPNIEWERVNGFTMDEYMGLPVGSPKLLANFAQENIFSKVRFKNEFVINGTNPDFEGECERYAQLLRKYPLDIACLGIGENGHLAYNDPHIADFNDSKLVKVVEIDEKSRMQAVHDGVFPSIDETPKVAMTITIPVMTNAVYKSIVVPSKFKSNIIRATVEDPVSTACPATILRNYDCLLYTDADSASLLV